MVLGRFIGFPTETVGTLSWGGALRLPRVSHWLADEDPTSLKLRRAGCRRYRGEFDFSLGDFETLVGGGGLVRDESLVTNWNDGWGVDGGSVDGWGGV